MFNTIKRLFGSKPEPVENTDPEEIDPRDPVVEKYRKLRRRLSENRILGSDAQGGYEFFEEDSVASRPNGRIHVGYAKHEPFWLGTSMWGRGRDSVLRTVALRLEDHPPADLRVYRVILSSKNDPQPVYDPTEWLVLIDQYGKPVAEWGTSWKAFDVLLDRWEATLAEWDHQVEDAKDRKSDEVADRFMNGGSVW